MNYNFVLTANMYDSAVPTLLNRTCKHLNLEFSHSLSVYGRHPYRIYVFPKQLYIRFDLEPIQLLLLYI